MSERRVTTDNIRILPVSEQEDILAIWTEHRDLRETNRYLRRDRDRWRRLAVEAEAMMNRVAMERHCQHRRERILLIAAIILAASATLLSIIGG